MVVSFSPPSSMTKADLLSMDPDALDREKENALPGQCIAFFLEEHTHQ